MSDQIRIVKSEILSEEEFKVLQAEDHNGNQKEWADAIPDEETRVKQQRKYPSTKVEVDMKFISQIPLEPPFKVLIANLPFDTTKEDIEKFFENLLIMSIDLEKKGPIKSVDFGTLDSLIRALKLNKKHIKNREIRLYLPIIEQPKPRNGPKQTTEVKQEAATETTVVAITKKEVDLSTVPEEGPFKAFVSNIIYNTRREELAQFFNESEIKNIDFPKRYVRYCFVEFNDRESLINALALTDNMFKGKQIKVRNYKKREYIESDEEQSGHVQEDTQYTNEDFEVYVGNLPYGFTEADIKEFFGDIEFTKITNPEGHNKGHCFVFLKDEESYQKALAINRKEFKERKISVRVPDHKKPRTYRTSWHSNSRYNANVERRTNAQFKGYKRNRVASTGSTKVQVSNPDEKVLKNEATTEKMPIEDSKSQGDANVPSKDVENIKEEEVKPAV